MKKLIIRDHLGGVVFEADVYLEGQDYHHVGVRPEPIWLLEVHICDPDRLPMSLNEELAELVSELEPEPEPEPIPHVDEVIALPELTKTREESIEDGELETAIDSSIGDEGADTAKQPKGLEATPKKSAKRKPNKRGK